MRENEIGNVIVDAALKVHTALGAGLLENAYEACLAYELEKRGLRTQKQLPVSLVYEEVKLDVGYRLDLLVENLRIARGIERNPLRTTQGGIEKNPLRLMILTLCH